VPVLFAPPIDFQPAINYAGGNSPTDIYTADLNGDGSADLILANRGGNGIAVLLGKPDGTFQPARGTPVPEPLDIVFADLNGDGKPDALVASGGVAILLGNGDGTFAAVRQILTAGATYAVAAADLNADGKPDLVFTTANTDGLWVMLNKGDGIFG